MDFSPPLGLPGTPTTAARYSGSTITFTWSQGNADDPESGIAGYWLEVGTEPEKGDLFDSDVGNVLSRSIPNCEDGKTYYARVRARNSAGLYGSFSATSNGVIIDATPPFGSLSLPLGSYSTSTGLSFTWTKGSADDPESGIAGYWLEVGTELGKGNLFNGDVGNVLSKSISNCKDGKIYYARVRARNSAGLYGNYSPVSNGVSIDIPLPTLVSINPKVGLNTSPINVVLSGTGFINEAIVKLRKDGEPDIMAYKMVVENPNKITCRFDLSKVQSGKWDVMVSNTPIKDCVLKNGFKVLMSPTTKQEIITKDGKVKAEIEPFALGESYYIVFNLNPSNDNINIANQKLFPFYNRISSSLVEMLGFNENDTPFTHNFTAPATITISYLDSNQDGMVDHPSLIEKDLAVYKLVGTGSTSHWEKIEGSIVNSLANTVSAPINSFSTYILMGPAYPITSLKGIYAYPNPAFSKDKRIIFKGLPNDKIVIRIYNIASELIIEKEVFGDSWIWDMKNKQGREVASGVYIWILKDNKGQKAFGKIGIIK
ncbi:MAG: fibronectin type III domain-containing protein [bacterium]